MYMCFIGRRIKLSSYKIKYKEPRHRRSLSLGTWEEDKEGPLNIVQGVCIGAYVAKDALYILLEGAKPYRIANESGGWKVDILDE